ncbi:uncharacterized protein EV154DRAFT_540974 [Mucor mucedo]|uniref:uncharacterized protein n=1 Tax=Mucor mucedo TaxID=29922 RepID=UPI00221F02C4|nr:uncharacterized protein EV154DRAFT_540974 [Mucor mucedo]KAI7866947.1 hypothetical protein EV154DRAFT_540974 [Mucor mucedo]
MIIGYVRKSPSDVNFETRLKLVQQMVDNLRDRSLVDKVYVSVSSHASSPFNERDLNKNDGIMEKLNHVTGNTSDMLEYLQSIDHDICLTSIDFAGIASRAYLVKDLLEEYPIIKKVAIETFISNNEILLLDSQLLLSDNQVLERFDCRKKLIQRSK